MFDKHSAQTSCLIVGQLQIDLPARCAWLNGEPVALTSLEFDVLVCLIRSAGQCLSPGDLLHQVWKYEQGGTDGQVHSCLKRLRRKLIAAVDDPPYIVRYHKCYRALTDAEWWARKV